MATTENNGLMIYKDPAGNKFIMYPITKAELVDGLDEKFNAHNIDHEAHGDIREALGSHTHDDLYFTKEQDVTAETLAKFGLPANGIPDNAFSTIADYLFGVQDLSYRWLRTKSAYEVSIGNEKFVESSFSHINVQYSSNYTTNGSTVALVSPIKSISVGYPAEASPLNGKYFSTTNKYNQHFGRVFLFTRCDITVDTSGDDMDSVNIYGREVTSTLETKTEIVTSSNPNAYPDSGTDADGWTYNKLDPIVAKVGLVETGSYVGTGTAGMDGATEIQCGFAPRFFAIIIKRTDSGHILGVHIGIKGCAGTFNLGYSDSQVSSPGNSSNFSESTTKVASACAIFGDTSLKVYANRTGNDCFYINASSCTYYYVVFG